MAEQNTLLTFDLNRELLSLKKGEMLLTKELQQIINFFNQMLTLKEKIRNNLKEKISKSESSRDDHFENLKKVVRNIEIYGKNLEQVKEQESELSKRETWIKTRYEEVLHGSSSIPLISLANEESEIFGDLCQELLSINDDLKKITTKTNREDLSKCREEYLKGLQRLFQKLDEELEESDGERDKLKKIRIEIEGKRSKAYKQQSALKKNYALLVEDIQKKKMDLDISVQEERHIISEYRQFIEQIKSSVKISSEVEELMKKNLPSLELLSSSDCNAPRIFAPLLKDSKSKGEE